LILCLSIQPFSKEKQQLVANLILKGLIYAQKKKSLWTKPKILEKLLFKYTMIYERMNSEKYNNCFPTRLSLC
jgi:hypothetical protein